MYGIFCIFANGMIIKAGNIVKSFGTVEVLKGVDFEAREREVVAIMGASGAGKSTLLQILGTLLTPDSGTLEIDGVNPLAMGSKALAAFRNRRIGFVFQAHHLLPEFSAVENVMIPALIGGASARDARARAEELLGLVGLRDRLTHKPSELSGGEQQRVAIARAIVQSPAILFADEPSGNLDTRTKEDIHALFFRLREELGQTTVIVTHDPSLAALCDRTCHMQDGRFI
jgi:lipoprotein-releasing system ATP-binding protein